MTRVGLVWAQARGGVIGAGGGMPWHVPEDLAHFKAVTGGHAVVMGRRTWESLPERFRPLPGRMNIVVTRNADWRGDGAVRAGSLDEALAAAPGAAVWVIGGGQLYRDAIGRADVLEVTHLDLDVPGDTYAPPLDGFVPVEADPAQGWHRSAGGVGYRFVRYEPEA
ncbi:dihydrofolate reductase [Microbacterium sp. GXF7504]